MACYTTEDHAAIMKTITGIDGIKAEVAKYKAQFEAVDVSQGITSGKYKADAHLNGPDPKDKDTPDAWVPRNPWVNRLTGIHPFQCEAPVSLLKEHGFLTPQTVHYVRNHGHAPKLSWAEHTIDISGLVDRPMKLTMAELVKLPSITVPVTLNCAGNRRKEQNIIQKGIGFNWGCAAASTAIWTGVPLPVVMEYVGMKSKADGANWINFEGPKGEVPQGDTTYGASHRREAMLNPARPVMLAFMNNGELLHPDHGYPVRLLIPGYIGGRMIKWLTKITITAEEGHNHYHIYDNRVFPKHITSKEEATKHNIWTDYNYVINDRNINSAIWAPAHCEKVALSQKTYKVGGYAYNGAGRPVNRVEVTMNDGHTWLPAEILRFEEANQYGMSYCWVHWHVEISVKDLQQCHEIAVCAWDDSINRQPELPSWNLMGMMNNNWFRVKVHDLPSGGGIWFEHPTRVEPGVNHYWDRDCGRKDDLYLKTDGSLPSPGWMERLKDMVAKAHEPLPLEQQPADGLEYAQLCLDIKAGVAGSGGKLPKKVKKTENAMVISSEAMSGDGSLENVGIKMNGKFKSPVTNQTFDTQEALDLHLKYLHDPKKASNLEE